MFYDNFTVPTEFSACIPYMQQIAWLYKEVVRLNECVNNLNTRVTALENAQEDLTNGE